LLKDASSNLEIMEQDDDKVDMTKVVIKVNGLTGEQLYKELDKKRIDIEKYTQQAIVVTIHTNIQEEEVRFLA
jgi:arginine/lysine/ornithine decarboxylase